MNAMTPCRKFPWRACDVCEQSEHCKADGRACADQAIFDVGPLLATVEDGPEPSLRAMIRSFYNRHAIVDPDGTTDQYIAALMAPGKCLDCDGTGRTESPKYFCATCDGDGLTASSRNSPPVAQPLCQPVPDRIYLLDCGSGDISWCDDPDPDGANDDAVAVEYVRVGIWRKPVDPEQPS